MSFYGNITNTNKTTFQFDRIYPNRVSMEANIDKDGIFIGRYVLIEYDKEFNHSYLTRVYTDDNITFYTAPGTKEKDEQGKEIVVFQEATKILFDPALNNQQFANIEISEEGETTTTNTYVGRGWIGYIIEEDRAGIATNIKDNTYKYYICNNVETSGKGVDATFVELTGYEEATTTYDKNYQIDRNAWGQHYDSTVWVKASVVSDDGSRFETKYVNIAELNSVVPSFDVTVDPPTMTPIKPHFDTDSTNVYYKLHVQPTYGLRVDSAEDNNGYSDEKTTWKSVSYDPKEGKWTESEEEVDAAIYYNKNGFNPNVKSYDNNAKDIISILPTGSSGVLYNQHNSSDPAAAKDIQEIKINLPSIGNMMSEAWDIIHGPNRDDSKKQYETEGGPDISSLQGRLDSISAMNTNQLAIKLEEDGSLSGTTINGATQRTVNENAILREELHIDDFEQDDAWIRTEVDSTRTDENRIAIHHTFHATEDTTSYTDKNDESNNLVEGTENEINKSVDTIDLYTPKIDAAGHVVGKNIETVTLPYGYKTISIATQSTAISNPIVNTTNIVADNTQDILTFASSNKWIRMSNDENTDTLNIGHEVHSFDTDRVLEVTNLNTEDGASNEENINIPDITYDEAGHITGYKAHYYTLPFGFKTINLINDTETISDALSNISQETVADQTQDSLVLQTSNKWIKLDNKTPDTIQVGHTTLYDTETNQTEYNTTNDQKPNFGETISIAGIAVDNAGHVSGTGTSATITIPQGSYTPANSASESKKVITNIGFTKETGAITSDYGTTNTLQLDSYDAVGKGTDDVANNDTINTAFAKLQNQINDMDMEASTSTTQFITKIEQIDGKVAVTRANAGTLVLGTASKEETVKATDNLNTAINALETRIRNEEDRVTALIGGTELNEAFDTIKEISDWLASNDSDADKIIDGVKTNSEAIKKEVSDRESAVSDLKAELSESISDVEAAAANKTTELENSINNININLSTNYSTTGNDSTYAKVIDVYTKEDVDKALAGKQDKIDNLENIIADLTSRLEALENNNSETV